MGKLINSRRVGAETKKVSPSNYYNTDDRGKEVVKGLWLN
jgi:hypothetical protein